MVSSPSSAQNREPANPLAGWDIAVAAIALAVMTTGFWRLWPDALALNDAPLGPILLKAGVAALGFVAIASRWEQSLSATLRNPFGLVFIALACTSAIWAVMPNEALRNGILFLVIWGFGVSLALRFKPVELAEICGFAGIFGIIMQVTAHQAVPPVDHFDGDLAFALIGCLWAALQVPARRHLWIIATGLCFAFAFAAAERATLGAVLGFAFGIGLASLGGMIARKGAISVLVTAWAIVLAIVVATCFIMFGAGAVSDAISRYFSDLADAMIIGQGFGVAGHSVGDAIGAGLGIVGTCLAMLVVLATFFQCLFGSPSGTKAMLSYAGVCFGCVGAMIVAPGEIALFGPIVILFAGSTFAISLASLPAPRSRRPLFADQRRSLATAPSPRLAARAAFRPTTPPAVTQPAKPAMGSVIAREPKALAPLSTSLAPPRLRPRL
jgi:hypothetical protein